MAETHFTEEQLARIEASASAEAIPELVRVIRDHQRTLDSLQLKLDVALRDRDELRTALLRCQQQLREGKSG